MKVKNEHRSKFPIEAIGKKKPEKINRIQIPLKPKKGFFL